MIEDIDFKKRLLFALDLLEEEPYLTVQTFWNFQKLIIF